MSDPRIQAAASAAIPAVISQEGGGQECGKTFIAWAEYDVQYITRVPSGQMIIVYC